eukprot:UN00852
MDGPLVKAFFTCANKSSLLCNPAPSINMRNSCLKTLKFTIPFFYPSSLAKIKYMFFELAKN